MQYCTVNFHLPSSTCKKFVTPLDSMRILQIVLFYSRYTFQITFWYSWSPIYVLNIFISGLLSLGFTFITPLYTS